MYAVSGEGSFLPTDEPATAKHQSLSSSREGCDTGNNKNTQQNNSTKRQTQHPQEEISNKFKKGDLSGKGTKGKGRQGKGTGTNPRTTKHSTNSNHPAKQKSTDADEKVGCRTEDRDQQEDEGGPKRKRRMLILTWNLIMAWTSTTRRGTTNSPSSERQLLGR